MITSSWPPFFRGFFAYFVGQAIAVFAAVKLLGEWPDDPLLLLPYMAVAYGVVGGALASAIALAPAVYWSRRMRGPRPWCEMLLVAAAAALGAALLSFALLGTFLLDMVPAMTALAAIISASGGAITTVAYALLSGWLYPSSRI